jgi:choline dehydrogenase
MSTLTRRVLFDGRRACGIEVEAEGAVQRIEASREVILCAGAIGSPQILLLSGVGEPADLRQHGIRPVAAVPAVGRHLEDHPIVPVMYDTPKGVSLSHRLKGLGRYRVGLQWLLFKSGIGAESMGQTGCFFRSTPDAEYADLQHEFYPLLADIDDPEANFSAGLLFSLGLMRPWSRGQVSLKSADPKAHPRLVLNYLMDARDRHALVEGVKRTREMAAQKAFDGMRLGEVQPGPDVRSDGEILNWLRQMATTEYHVCASCRMGVDDDSVTDGTGRVHDTEALRVVDASIMRHNLTANLNMPVIMMAEKLADVIRGRAPLPASTLVPQ